MDSPISEDNVIQHKMTFHRWKRRILGCFFLFKKRFNFVFQKCGVVLDQGNFEIISHRGKDLNITQNSPHTLPSISYNILQNSTNCTYIYTFIPSVKSRLPIFSFFVKMLYAYESVSFYGRFEMFDKLDSFI